MNESRYFVQIRKRRLLLITSALLLGLFTLHFTAYGQDKSSFPDGFDAVQAARKAIRSSLKMLSYGCSKFQYRPTRQYPCIITAGQV